MSSLLENRSPALSRAGLRLSIALMAALVTPAASAQLRFQEHLIASDLKGGYQVVVTDVNHDAKPDLIALASGMKDLLWFEGPAWERHVMASGLSRMINLTPVDTDRDGIPEIVVAHEFANQAANSIGIVSLLQHQGDPRQPWSVREIDRLTTSHRLRTADIDGSGRPVVINAPLTGAKAAAPDYRDHTPLVFYRPGEWKRETIGEDNEGVVHGIFIQDWDGRRDAILTASFLGLHLHRLVDGRWQRTELAKGDPAAWPKSGSSDVAVGRLGRRRFLAAIEPWHGNQVSVYFEHNGGWQRNVIDDSLVDGHTIQVADLDGDKRDEIVAGFRGKGRSVYIYRADRDGLKWQRQTLDDGGIAAAACAVADLDADKRPDIACIGSATANLKWYKNLRT